jgi:DNA-binding HxlR family transcriptional regulator
MSTKTWTSPGCPVARAVDIVGDKWSLLIIRDAFDGIRRFGQFQRNLGVAKNILSVRLQNLVETGVLRVEPASDGSSYREYVLTEKGQDLFDLVISLRQWGQDHAYEPGEQHARLVDRATEQPVPRLVYTAPDGARVRAGDTRVLKSSEEPRPTPSGQETEKAVAT